MMVCLRHHLHWCCSDPTKPRTDPPALLAKTFCTSQETCVAVASLHHVIVVRQRFSLAQPSNLHLICSILVECSSTALAALALSRCYWSLAKSVEIGSSCYSWEVSRTGLYGPKCCSSDHSGEKPKAGNCTFFKACRTT